MNNAFLSRRSSRAARRVSAQVHGSVESQEGYEALLRETFSFAEDDVASLARQLADGALSFGGTTTRCSQLHGPRCEARGPCYWSSIRVQTPYCVVSCMGLHVTRGKTLRWLEVWAAEPRA
jgi:hypothetical protein